MRHAFVAIVFSALLAAPAAGQVIPIRTAPIVRADRLEIFPSGQAGMAGVSIALSDSLGGLSANPAAGARVTGARLISSPVLYAVSGGTGGGRALPLAVVARRGDWFGAGALALQAVEPGHAGGFGGPVPLDGQEDPARARSSAYGFALLGKSWSASGLSIAASVLAARRKTVDGIGLLFGESEGVESSGGLSVFRFGLLKEWPGARTFEAVAVRSRTRLVHDVTYADWFWEPEQQMPVATLRDEREADAADVWGLHLVHARPFAPGWRLGWVIIANRVSFPSVPRYDVPSDGIMDIASGRGDGHAYNIGVGFATTDRPLRLGVDLVYEPIWSRIWGVADTATTTAGGGLIPAGGRTIENRLRFSNGIIRLGAGHEWRLDREGNAVEVQLGVATRVMDYRLAQFDHRQDAGRDHHARWVEWTPTWGTAFRLGEVEVRYHASMLEGTKRPGAATPVFAVCEVCLSIAPGPQPRDVSELGEVSVITQQVYVSVALGGSRQGGGRP